MSFFAKLFAGNRETSKEQQRQNLVADIESDRAAQVAANGVSVQAAESSAALAKREREREQSAIAIIDDDALIAPREDCARFLRQEEAPIASSDSDIDSGVSFDVVVARIVRHQARTVPPLGIISLPTGDAARSRLTRAADRLHVENMSLHVTLAMLEILQQCNCYDLHTQSLLIDLIGSQSRQAKLLAAAGQSESVRSRLTAVLDVLLKQQHEFIRSFRTCFPGNRPRDALARLLHTTSRMIALQASLGGTADSSADTLRTMVSNAVHESATRDIKRCALRVDQALANSDIERLIPSSMSASRLLILCDLAIARLLDVEVFADSVATHCDLMLVYARAFHSGVIEQATSDLSVSAVGDTDLGMHLFPLASKVHDFLCELELVAKKCDPAAPPLQHNLDSAFGRFLAHWTQQSAEKMHKWAKAACAVDDWQVVDEDMGTSASVGDVLQACSQLVDTVRERSFLSGALASGDCVLASAMRGYCDEVVDVELRVMNSTLNDLQRFHHDLVMHDTVAVAAVPLETSSCVRANDLHGMLLSLVEHNLERSEYGATAKYVKWSLATQMTALVLVLARASQALIARAVCSDEPSDTDALIGCIDSHLTVANNNLHGLVFVLHVKQTIEHCMAVIEHTLVSHNDRVRSAEQLISRLRRFFNEVYESASVTFGPLWERFASLVDIVRSSSAALSTSDEAKSDARALRVLEARARSGDNVASAYLRSLGSRASTVAAEKERGALEIKKRED
jgi:hypothetical protein